MSAIELPIASPVSIASNAAQMSSDPPDTVVDPLLVCFAPSEAMSNYL
jgi:hypothetical protein